MAHQESKSPELSFLHQDRSDRVGFVAALYAVGSLLLNARKYSYKPRWKSSALLANHMFRVNRCSRS